MSVGEVAVTGLPLDPGRAATPVCGGLCCREAHLAPGTVAELGLAGSKDVVEVNPI